jgi:hypothetical protein
MDPKALSNMDPKLRETYERVMGTSAPAGSPPAASTAPPPPASPIPTPSTNAVVPPSFTDLSGNPPPPPTEKPVTVSGLSASPDGSNPLPPLKPAMPDAAAPQNPLAAATAPAFGQPLPSPASVNQAQASPSSTLRILYIVLGVIFFILYTIFWIKVFNLPFLF